MSQSVFISFSSKDEDVIKEFCCYLEDAGVDFWVSFRDIEPGSEWDLSIEAALEAATHLIVAVTGDSLASRYVRGEVETALTDGKKVIPVLFEKASLPIGWRTLQYFDLTPGINEKTIRPLVEILPKNIETRLSTYLQNQQDFPELKRLLWNSPQIVSNRAISKSQIEALMGIPDKTRTEIVTKLEEKRSRMRGRPGFLLFTIRNSFPDISLFDLLPQPIFNPEIHNCLTAFFVVYHKLAEHLNPVDFFTVPGLSALQPTLTILGNPYQLPFTDAGWSEEILEQLDVLKNASIEFVGLMRESGHNRGEIRLEVYAGQRKHYDESAEEERFELEREQSRRITRELNWENESNFYLSVSVPTYDRLIDRMY